LLLINKSEQKISQLELKQEFFLIGLGTIELFLPVISQGQMVEPQA